MWPSPTFTEESINGKHFLCSVGYLCQQIYQILIKNFITSPNWYRSRATCKKNPLTVVISCSDTDFLLAFFCIILMEFVAGLFSRLPIKSNLIGIWKNIKLEICTALLSFHTISSYSKNSCWNNFLMSVLKIRFLAIWQIWVI